MRERTDEHEDRPQAYKQKTKIGFCEIMRIKSWKDLKCFSVF